MGIDPTVQRGKEQGIWEESPWDLACREVVGLEGPGGGWRPGLGGAAPSWGRGLDAREATHPSPNTRCPFSRSAAEPGLGAGEAGVIPEGIPPPHLQRPGAPTPT